MRYDKSGNERNVWLRRNSGFDSEQNEPQQQTAGLNHFLCLPLMSITIVGCGVRVAPPLHVGPAG